MSLLKLPLLVDLQRKLGEIFLSITSCTSIIILGKYYKLVHRQNVVMVTLTTGKMFRVCTDSL
jgi:hypothetical protein